jgi:hypothetical protein
MRTMDQKNFQKCSDKRGRCRPIPARLNILCNRGRLNDAIQHQQLDLLPKL